MDKLTLYNMALGHLNSRSLASLSEASEPRRVLDTYYNVAVEQCLEEGYWNFTIRTVRIDASVSVVPPFGMRYAFQIPTDWVRTLVVSTVETLIPPLLDYKEETGYWYSDWNQLFVSYISNDTAYGMDMSRWTANFSLYVSLQLAEHACARVTGSSKLLEGPTGISARLKKAKLKAKSMDAMNDPPGFAPTGTWARSRRGFLRGLPMPGGDLYDD